MQWPVEILIVRLKTYFWLGFLRVKIPDELPVRPKPEIYFTANKVHARKTGLNFAELPYKELRQ